MKPISDPPMVTVLAEPLRRLRSGLGSGAPAPDQQVLGALTTASATADATESTQTRGLHALESSWSGQAADTAVPVIRTTRSEIGAVADRGPQYAALLSDAHSTSSRAAREVDVIIDDFRRDARAILDTATSAPETDAVIDRAAQAIREALGVVNTAQGEMDGHRQRLRDMGPMTMTTPQGVLTTPGTTIPGTTTTVPGTVPGQPMDPALVMQLQLQQQLVAAGVQLGTTAIDAGVELGTKIIDRIADVGLKVVDTVGAQAGTAIEQALNPGKADNAETGPASTAPRLPRVTLFRRRHSTSEAGPRRNRRRHRRPPVPRWRLRRHPRRVRFRPNPNHPTTAAVAGRSPRRPRPRVGTTAAWSFRRAPVRAAAIRNASLGPGSSALPSRRPCRPWSPHPRSAPTTTDERQPVRPRAADGTGAAS